MILAPNWVTDASRAVSLQALPAASRPLPERSEEQEAVDLALKLLELRWICCISFSLYILVILVTGKKGI